ncbi:hypothetical protein PROFUN_14834 [Planoprotostelium fungivorum]|uniref:Uncharacterized protein n=1 Tax=Planoprotostelium fungivorum TaxID=1890364 RepID=A0A2P6MNF6_9EUKA|nr:hypothetical protein PROFUN_14834 [Planoprotostelium fungivorum]
MNRGAFSPRSSKLSRRCSVRLDVDDLTARIAHLEAYVAELESLTSARSNLAEIFQESIGTLREQLEESQRERSQSTDALIAMREKILLLEDQLEENSENAAAQLELEQCHRDAEMMELREKTQLLESELHVSREQHEEELEAHEREKREMEAERNTWREMYEDMKNKYEKSQESLRESERKRLDLEEMLTSTTITTSRTVSRSSSGTSLSEDAKDSGSMSSRRRLERTKVVRNLKTCPGLAEMSAAPRLSI